MINVTKTYLPYNEKLIEYFDKIYTNGWITNNGELTQELERKLQKFLGVEHLVLVSNGTLALQIAYKALELKGEVITTPFSFVATTSSLVWEGLKPIFADIESKTFTINPEKIIQQITKKTSAILPVHVYGNPCEVNAIAEIAKQHQLKIIYDAAHAFGVKLGETSILNYGDISTLSFHATKLFHTIEGGAIIAKDPDVYKKIKKLINFGIIGPDKIEGLGINAKFNEFQAAMGLCVLDDLDIILQGRKRVYERYQAMLSKNILTERSSNSSQNYSYYPILLRDENELLVIKKSLEDIYINTRRYFYPSLNTLDYVDKMSCPVSEDISKRILCLPMYDDLPDDIIDKIGSLINKICIKEELQCY
jgi:dTDP-4-amino-4,6-dideoxygalactose transaminase